MIAELTVRTAHALIPIFATISIALAYMPLVIALALIALVLL